MSVVQNAPEGEGGEGTDHGAGEGPAGAVAVLAYPAEVREQTLFDHLELHWNPVGHEPEGIYSLPHFDLHFFDVPPSEVLAVDCVDLIQPAAERIPAPYIVTPGCVPVVVQLSAVGAPGVTVRMLAKNESIESGPG